MKEILDKLSSYNIFNNLMPGVLFVIFTKSLTDYNFIQSDILLGSFLYYFLGMVISRFGSVVYEPVLKKIKILKFKDYSSYVSASKKDVKIELLSEVNNAYRTINAMLFLIFAVKIYNLIATKFQLSDNFSTYFSSILIFILFLFSYTKQTKYINKRIEANEQEIIT